MATSDWREAAKHLKAVAQQASAHQRSVASKLGIKLPARVPERVAAVLIAEALHEALVESHSGPPTAAQQDYLRDLAKGVRARLPAEVPTQAQIEAWITVMQARRAEKALRTLQLSSGDIVAPVDRPDDEADEVSSIDVTGRVYFRGGNGASARAHILRVLARAGNHSEDAKAAKKKAANRRALRSRLGGPPTAQRLAPLKPHQVKGALSTDGLSELEDTLDEAKDERPLQELLTRRPGLLARITVSSFGTFVVPLPRLGERYVPDFVLVVADSAGIHYTLVELESPRQRLSLKDGQLSAKAREALQQIESWREWLKDNLTMAQRPREANGLGLPEIRPDSPGLVLIGRRSEITPTANLVMRQRLREQLGISFHTYDWLSSALRSSPNGRIRAIDVSPDWEPPNLSFMDLPSGLPEGSPFD